MIGQKLRLRRKAFWPHRHAVGELEGVVHQQVHHYHLDLIAGEVAPGARVPAIAKGHGVEVRRRILKASQAGRIGGGGA